MSYTKTVWTNDALPAINATNLNNIENGIKGNEAKIDSLVLGENLKGEFTPSIAQEYPLSPAINDSWYIDGLTGAGYTFTTGILTGQTADNFDKLVYISTGWFLVEDTQNYVHNTGDETIAGVKTFSSSPIVPAPTTDLQASTKKYVDDSVASSTLDINALTEKTTPVDADELAIADSATTFSLKKLTWANLKATLKTYFDTLYGSITWVANDARAKTALNATGDAPIYACRAWVNFNGTGTVAIRASGNVSSITDNGTGDYTVNFATDMPDIDFQYAYGHTQNSSGSFINAIQEESRTVSYINIRSVLISSNTSGSLYDCSAMQISIHR